MPSQTLLDYIRQNQGAGFSKTDIEAALGKAGWSAQDIAAGFLAIEHPEAIIAPPPAGQPPQDETAAELARIQAELARVQKQKPASRFVERAPNTSRGIIGFLVARNIVKSESQANIVLLSIALACIALSVWLLWPKSSATKSIPSGPPTTLPAQKNVAH